MAPAADAVTRRISAGNRSKFQQDAGIAGDTFLCRRTTSEQNVVGGDCGGGLFYAGIRDPAWFSARIARNERRSQPPVRFEQQTAIVR